MSLGGTLITQINNYAARLGALRQRAGDPQRDTYTVALGQLVACGLLERSQYDALMALPRIERAGGPCACAYSDSITCGAGGCLRDGRAA